MVNGGFATLLFNAKAGVHINQPEESPPVPTPSGRMESDANYILGLVLPRPGCIAWSWGTFVTRHSSSGREGVSHVSEVHGVTEPLFKSDT